MQEHPNATLVRTALEGQNAGDPTGVTALIADDVVWHEIGREEPIRGKEALLARFAELGDAVEVNLDVHDVVGGDDHVVALVTATARRGADSLTYRVAEIAHIRDGMLVERWAFSDDTERINRFFSQSEA